MPLPYGTAPLFRRAEVRVVSGKRGGLSLVAVAVLSQLVYAYCLVLGVIL